MNFDDAAQRLVELAASRHNAFHTTEAADAGVSPQRLRRARARGELVELRPKIWALAGRPSTAQQNLRAATLVRSDAAAMGPSAAWLHGWLSEPPPEVTLWAPPGGVSSIPGTRLRRLASIDPRRDVVEIDGIRCMNKAATLCLFGDRARRPLVERCLDEFLRTESTTWLDRTLDRLTIPGVSGPRVLIDVMCDPKRVRGATDSWMERVVAQLLANPESPPLSLQHAIEVNGRRRRVDLAIPSIKLGIEAHSRTFHWGPSKENADNVRDLEIATAGWQLLYVTWAQIHDPDRFVKLVMRTIRVRHGQLAAPNGKGW